MPTINLGRVRFNWIGPYDPLVAYLEYDCVEQDGQSYVCIAPVTGTGPLDAGGSTYWDPMLVRSADYNQARDDAIAAATDSEDSATAAAGSASSAAGSASSASGSATKADQWANEAEDVEVEAGKYSAKHYAQKAAAFGDPNQFDITADQTVDTRTSAEWMAALLVAQQKANDNEASASANAAELVTRSRKNLLINGGFDIWQRGSPASFATAFVNNKAGATADRWFAQAYTGNPGGGDVSLAVSQEQDSSTDQLRNVFRFNCTQFDAPYDTTAIQRIEQSIEGLKAISGRIVTLSFRAKADAVREFAVGFSQVFGTGGAPSSTVHFGGERLVTEAGFADYSVTVQVPSIVGKTLGTNGNDRLRVSIILYKNDDTELVVPSGAVGVAGPVDFELSDVQLEFGDTETDFEYRPVGEELALCQRYFVSETKSFTVGWDQSFGYNAGSLSFPVTMRATPSITILGGSFAGHHGNAPSVFDAIRDNSFSCRFTGADSRTDASGIASVAYQADAEV